MMPPIRIAIVIGHLTYGGAERQVYELAVGLRQFTSYQPMVLCYSPFLHPFGERLIAEGIQVNHLDRKVNHLAKLNWIRKQLINHQCKIVYAFLNTANINCWLASLNLKIKLITSVRGLPTLSPLLNLGLRLSFRGSHKIIANSESGKQWAVVTKGAHPEKIVVIPNAVRKYQRRELNGVKLRHRLNIPINDVVIGTIARLDYPKRPELLLDIANKFLDQRTNVHFVWAGNGSQSTKVKEKLSQYYPDKKLKIHFLDPIENIDEYLSLFDIFYLISDREGLSNSLMEAMSVGLPCVCSASPGNTDIINNYNDGILVSNECNAWVDALVDLMNKPDLAYRLGANAAKQMASFTTELYSKNTAAVFNCLMLS